MSDYVFTTEHRKWTVRCWQVGERFGITASKPPRERNPGQRLMTVMDSPREALEKIKCWIENKPYQPEAGDDGYRRNHDSAAQEVLRGFGRAP